MSFDWADYLQLAEILKETPEDRPLSEAAFRSATSRAYYAAFHHAKGHASSEGFSPSDSGDDHQNVQRHFRRGAAEARAAIATKLGRLLTNRNQADYDDHFRSSPRALANMSVKTAQEVFVLIDSLAHLE